MWIDNKWELDAGGNKKGLGKNRTLFNKMAGTKGLEPSTFPHEMRDVLTRTELHLRLLYQGFNKGPALVRFDRTFTFGST